MSDERTSTCKLAGFDSALPDGARASSVRVSIRGDKPSKPGRRPEPSVPPIAVSVTHAAQMLDCTRQHVYQLIERGTLKRLTIAGSSAVRIAVADVYVAVGLEPPT